MKTFVYTVNCIENGKLEYNVVKIFTDVNEAVKTAKAEMQHQCDIWHVEPTLFREVRNFFKAYTVKHPYKEDYVKTYILQEAK